VAGHPLRPAKDRRLGGPLPRQLPNPTRAPPMAMQSLSRRTHTVLAPVSRGCSVPQGRFPRATHPCATKAEASVRLACVRHAASVRSEPGSNSQVERDAATEVTGPVNGNRHPGQSRNPSLEPCDSLRSFRDVPAGDPDRARTGPIRAAACASLLSLDRLVKDPAAVRTRAACPRRPPDGAGPA
jgi:hypothetical protein